MNSTTAKQLYEKGYMCVVVVSYDYADKHKGDVISKHRSYVAAQKKARGNDFWGIEFLSDLISGDCHEQQQ